MKPLNPRLRRVLIKQDQVNKQAFQANMGTTRQLYDIETKIAQMEERLSRLLVTRSF